MAAVNVNVKAEPEFLNGGLTSTKKAVREKAVRFIKESKDFAAAIGADKVTCCPLGDGFEFAFQCDYRKMWTHLVDAFGECGSYREEIPLFIEYKPSETRGKCFVDSAAKTLCLLHDIGLNNMGVTVDFGHSVYGGEQPAEAVALVAGSPWRLYIHINDNDGRWDWDYFCGTKHFLEYVEFLYYLKKYRLQGLPDLRHLADALGRSGDLRGQQPDHEPHLGPARAHRRQDLLEARFGRRLPEDVEVHREGDPGSALEKE